MKKAILILAVLLLTSCKTLKIVSNQDVHFNFASQKIELKNNILLVNCDIEDEQRSLIVDFGATSSILFDTLVIPNYSKREKGTFGSVKSADSKKSSSAWIALKTKNNLVNSVNKAFVVLPIYSESIQRYDCINIEKKDLPIGIYGYDLLSSDDISTVIDFDELTITNINNEEVHNSLKNGFQEVKSEFSSRWFSIFVLINGIEYNFKFDTGFTGDFTIPYNNRINFLNEKHLSFEGNLYHTVTGKSQNKKDYFFDEKTVSFNNTNYEAIVALSNSITSQNVGIGFIKGFNWIINYKDKKVFVKKNGVKIDKKSFFPNNYIVVAENHKLKIIAKNSDEEKFNVYDEITAVNNRKITPDNICEIKNLLNTTTDWSILNIEIKN